MRGTTRGRWGGAVLVAAALVLAAGCTDNHPGAGPSGPASSSTSVRAPKPAPPDQHLRDVARAMIYSDGIAHVLDETAAQMICGALSPTDWRQVFGAEVGRTVYGGVGAKCVVSTGDRLVVDLERTVEELGSVGERIAGHRVKVDGPSSSNRVAAASAALVPLGEQDIHAQQRVSARPVLHLLARANDYDQDPPDLTALLHRLLATLLPKLTAAGPATPVYDVAGKLAYTPTDRPAGVPIYDLPQTVQSLVLCTVVLRETGIRPQSAGILVNSVGECNLSRPHIFAKVDQFLDPVAESSPYTIAGRAAEERADIGIVINLLTMPAESDRTQYLVLRLTNFAPSGRLRPWAEKVAAVLLTG